MRMDSTSNEMFWTKCRWRSVDCKLFNDSDLEYVGVVEVSRDIQILVSKVGLSPNSLAVSVA